MEPTHHQKPKPPRVVFIVRRV